MSQNPNLNLGKSKMADEGEGLERMPRRPRNRASGRASGPNDQTNERTGESERCDERTRQSGLALAPYLWAEPGNGNENGNGNVNGNSLAGFPGLGEVFIFSLPPPSALLVLYYRPLLVVDFSRSRSPPSTNSSSAPKTLGLDLLLACLCDRSISGGQTPGTIQGNAGVHVCTSD
jgi:hypothetical protein